MVDFKSNDMMDIKHEQTWQVQASNKVLQVSVVGVDLFNPN